MRVKFMRDCWTGFGTVRKGMKGTVIAERKGPLIKVGEKTFQKDEYLIILRSVVTRFGGPPHDERFWFKKDEVKELSPWDLF